MKRLLIISLLVMASIYGAYAGIFWQMPIHHYIKQEYNGGTQNWMIRRGDNGWMYFANNKGLLEYDGVYWEQHEMGNNTKARSLFVSGGNVFVGGLGEFGVFRPDSNGKLVYNCLSAKIRDKRAINVWNIIRLRDKIYFQADNSIFAYSNSNGHIERIDSRATVYSVATIGDKVYVATASGLSVLSGRQLVRISGTEMLGGTKVIAILPYAGNVIVVTANSGLFIFDGHMMRKMVLSMGDKLNACRLSCAAISGETLALGTVHDGLILYNLRSRSASSIAVGDGLQNNSILSLYFEAGRNLWVGFYNGIDCVNVVSPLRLMSCSGADIGSGYASCLFGGRLFLGTNQGLYSTPPDGKADADFIPGADGLIHCLLPFDGNLFCGGRNFFGIYGNGGMHKFNIRGVWKVIPVRRMKNTLLVGTYWGLYLLKKDGKWEQPVKISDRGISTKTLCIEDGANAVWVANKSKGVWRYTMSDDFSRVVKSKQYNGKSLPVGENVCIAMVNGQLVVASPHGLFRYNITDDRLERYSEMEKKLGGKKAYTYITQDEKKNVWFAADETLFLLRYNNRTHRYATAPEAWLHGNLIADYENVSILHNYALLGTEDGYASLKLDAARVVNNGVRVMIRKVFSTADGTDSLLLEPRNVAPSGDSGDNMLRVEYNRAALRIEYCATDYDPTQTVLYSYRLDGSENEAWSEFSVMHVKEFTHLHEGIYTFRVRVMVNGVIQKGEGTLSFRVLPPWYRSWWAWTIYIICILLLARYAYKRMLESRQKIIRSSERKMAEQQQQFDFINEKKDQQIESLQLKNTEMELRIKNEELVNSQLNVVRKNEILQEIRSMVVKIANVVSEDNVPLVKRRLVKLMNQIDTNISHDDDLQAFQGSFNAVHNDFLKVLGERFPSLSHKDKMLCVYIRMNMQTKEIAPLLGISVRGVEISRYRLRKKLELEERESLTDFLQKLTD